MQYRRLNIGLDFLRALLASLIVGLAFGGASMLLVLLLANAAGAGSPAT